MIRKATTIPKKAKEVEWVRYTGDNFAEIEEFYNKKKDTTFARKEFFMSLDESKELYWKEHGIISPGDFIVYGMEHLNTKWDGFAIVSWKTFPRLVNEDIPVFLDDYRKWLGNEKGTSSQ